MTSGDAIKLIVALVPLGFAYMEHVEKMEAKRETIEVARTLSIAGNASAEAACRECP